MVLSKFYFWYFLVGWLVVSNFIGMGIIIWLSIRNVDEKVEELERIFIGSKKVKGCKYIWK